MSPNTDTCITSSRPRTTTTTTTTTTSRTGQGSSPSNRHHPLNNNNNHHFSSSNGGAHSTIPIELSSSNSNSINNNSPWTSAMSPRLPSVATSSRLGLFDRLPASAQFTVLVLGVFCFFGIHNLLQEAIMEIMNKQYGVMLGVTEVLGVCIFSYLERRCYVKEHGHVAPLSFYPLLTACLLGSSALSNIALNYINFPTKVVFRSSKLIPTMIIASLMHRKIFSVVEYACASAICAGLVLFAAADWELAPTFHPIGLLLVTLSVFADAVLPNAQERLFGMGASRLEVTLFTNIFALIAYTITTYASGDLTGALYLVFQHKKLAMYYLIYIVVAYFAISVHMNVVKRFGGVVAVLVATGRKGMTLILSFLLFPKAFSWYYPLGAVLVLGGLLMASLYKMNGKATSLSSSSLKSPSSPPPPATRGVKSHKSDLEMNSSSESENYR